MTHPTLDASKDRRSETFDALRAALDETGSFPGKAKLISAIFAHVEAASHEAIDALSASLRKARLETVMGANVVPFPARAPDNNPPPHAA